MPPSLLGGHQEEIREEERPGRTVVSSVTDGQVEGGTVDGSPDGSFAVFHLNCGAFGWFLVGFFNRRLLGADASVLSPRERLYQRAAFHSERRDRGTGGG